MSIYNFNHYSLDEINRFYDTCPVNKAIKKSGYYCGACELEERIAYLKEAMYILEDNEIMNDKRIDALEADENTPTEELDAAYSYAFNLRGNIRQFDDLIESLEEVVDSMKKMDEVLSFHEDMRAIMWNSIRVEH